MFKGLSQKVPTPLTTLELPQESALALERSQTATATTGKIQKVGPAPENGKKQVKS